MCYIKYANLECAINAMANLHNYYLNGRYLQISFTKFKIEWICSILIYLILIIYYNLDVFTNVK